MIFSKFIGGTSIHSAISNIKRLPYQPIFDYAKESAISQQDAYNYRCKMENDIKYMYGAMALKYSSFRNDYDINYIMKRIIRNKLITRVYLDAEQDEYHAVENKLYASLLSKYNSDHVYLYKTYQMYRQDAMYELISDIKAHPFLGIKLVRGAYMHKDKSIIHKTKEDTDEAYNMAVRYVLAQMKKRPIKVTIATHNDESIKIAVNLSPDKNRLDFAQLLGMNDQASYKLYKSGYTVYKYVPYGSFMDTYSYLVRRLYENYRILQYI
jgi:hypothetical protein